MRSAALPQQPLARKVNDEAASGPFTTNQLTKENYTIPPGQRHLARNLLVEQLSRVRLPGNAHSVINAIARTTIYCNRWWKFIDCHYLAAKTGMDPRTIRRTIGDLRRQNVLLYGPRNHQEDFMYRGRDKASAIGINFEFLTRSVPQRITPEGIQELDKGARDESDKDAQLRSGKDAQPHYETSKRTRATASPSASLDADGSQTEISAWSEPELQICLLCREETALPGRIPLCAFCSSLVEIETAALLPGVENLGQEDLVSLLREVGVQELEIEFCLSLNDRATVPATRWLALYLLQQEETK